MFRVCPSVGKLKNATGNASDGFVFVFVFPEVDPVISLTCFAGFKAERTAGDDSTEVK